MSPSGQSIPPLFKHWDTIRSRIQKSSRLVILLDFDGTLVRIARRPELVHVAASTRGVLSRLGRHKRVKVAIVSGRRRVELLRHIALRNIQYLGLYGWEGNGSSAIPLTTQAALSRMHEILKDKLVPYPEIWIEPKKNTLSVHLLGSAPQIQRRVRREIHTLVHPFRSQLRLLENLRDVEVIPLAIKGKGSAVAKILEKPTLQDAFPIYFGDDLSDEPAFAAVRKSGAGVLIGKPRRTNARFRLRGPADVTTALIRLEAALP